MKIRHRTPSIFNISMVDVLCCALGCVILLWLLNLREAKQKAAQAGRADEEVSSLRARLTGLGGELDESRSQLAELRSRYATAQAQVSETERDLTTTRRRLAGVEAEVRDTADRLRTVQGDRDALAMRAHRLDKDLAALRGEKATAEEDLAARTRAVGDLEKRLMAVVGRVEDLGKQLSASEARARGLEKEGARGNDALAARDRDLVRSRTELQMARQGLDILQGEKRALATEVERVRTAAENRFAGIALTGRRVVFLVDMSGSMKHIDLKTPAPDKWAAVSAAVAKVMRSLPDLEKFQIILFGEEVAFPLGRPGAWQEADRDSATRVLAALEKTNPEGHTNMYVGLEAAFGLREHGLDTVYLFSDGIPSRGPGLTTEQLRTLKETEQGDILGRYVRQRLQGEWNRDAGRGRVRINAIGFFFESPDVGAFLWALARENDGSFVGMSRP